MTTPATFGVTAADISARVQGVAIGDSTVPSTTTVGEIIEEAASFVTQEAEYIGVSTSAIANTTTTYKILRNLVIYRAAREVLIARDRADDRAAGFKVLYDEAIETLRKSAGRIADKSDAPDSVRSPVLSPDNTSAAAVARDNSSVGRVIRGGM